MIARFRKLIEANPGGLDRGSVVRNSLSMEKGYGLVSATDALTQAQNCYGFGMSDERRKDLFNYLRKYARCANWSSFVPAFKNHTKDTWLNADALVSLLMATRGYVGIRWEAFNKLKPADAPQFYRDVLPYVQTHHQAVITMLQRPHGEYVHLLTDQTQSPSVISSKRPADTSAVNASLHSSTPPKRAAADRVFDDSMQHVILVPDLNPPLEGSQAQPVALCTTDRIAQDGRAGSGQPVGTVPTAVTTSPGTIHVGTDPTFDSSRGPTEQRAQESAVTFLPWPQIRVPMPVGGIAPPHSAESVATTTFQSRSAAGEVVTDVHQDAATRPVEPSVTPSSTGMPLLPPFSTFSKNWGRAHNEHAQQVRPPPPTALSIDADLVRSPAGAQFKTDPQPPSFVTSLDQSGADTDTANPPPPFPAPAAALHHESDLATLLHQDWLLAAMQPELPVFPARDPRDHFASLSEVASPLYPTLWPPGTPPANRMPHGATHLPPYLTPSSVMHDRDAGNGAMLQPQQTPPNPMMGPHASPQRLENSYGGPWPP